MTAIDVSHKVVSREEWLEARKAHLAREKEFTRQRDELSRQRRELPRVKVEKNYVFDGPKGRETLADLFDGRSQLIVYHFMFGPGWKEGCPYRSFLADHIDGAVVHLAQHVSFTKDDIAKGKVYYNYAMREFQSEELPGTSVFYKEGSGDIFHTYSSHARGAIFCSVRITTSISRRRAATRPVPTTT